ncbi:serine phosphatase RsbU (regulator of sigma subunit) [Geodermatophilus tzadiensis]|uniref:Serine phosphatase RsbU (Regulator of sigma subunit) n=1 Tax=Geodermatophilus tzadiensis TaxID=1137988 RepID=A0A2T0TWG3_9ACTN|nr:SpoIIE family protein phosphatase [Geodermatophilus tzadiensis]PRY50034.1 serine phosphatase RsbU (regulator of sigma subunit) [Geodermatophilus tzadiensis]
MSELPVPDWERVFDVAPVPLVLLTPDLVIVRANRALLQAAGMTHEDTVGRLLFDVFPMPPDDPGADGLVNLRTTLEEARDTGRPVVMPIQEYDIPRPDGTFEERYWSPVHVPVLDDDGRVVLLVHRTEDITDYVRLRDEARGETDREQRRVADVEADLFRRTRELEDAVAELRALGARQRRTAQSLAGLAAIVSALAAAEDRRHLVDLLGEHGGAALGASLLALALPGPRGGELVLTASGAPVVRGAAADGQHPAAVAARGRVVLVGEAGAQPPPAPGLRSWAALPLRSGERLLGSLVVGWPGTRAFEDHDVRVLEALAVQTVQALERVTRLEDERRVASATRSLAETLQRSMLTEPPRRPALDLAVRYRPAAVEAQVGGDWYDAFASGEATTVVIGDVTGHDRLAAAVMGQVRNVLRGIAAAVGGPPSRVLATLDRALSGYGTATLATAVLATVGPAPADDPAGARTLTWSSAGHLPPLVVPPGGPPRLLDRRPDLLLGVDPTRARHDSVETLTPGTTVVLYTDGLVERRDADLDAGLDRLLAAAGDLAQLPAEEVCDALLARLAPQRADDVALLTLRVHRGPGPRAEPSPSPARGARVPAVPEPNGALPPWPSAT